MNKRARSDAARAVFEADILARAEYFTTVRFMGRGRYDRREFPTMAEAEKDAEGDRRALIYAIAGSRQVHINPMENPMIKTKPKSKEVSRGVVAKPAKAKKAAAPKAKAKKAAPAKAKEPKEKPVGKRAQILASAEAGKLPQAPDFSAATHAPYRKKLDELTAMVKDGDIKGLKAYKLNPISSSPKALDRYRNLAVIALAAKAA